MSYVKKLENVLQELVDKLDAVEGAITSLTTLAWVHGHRYKGPSYGKALEHAKEVLKNK